MTDEDKSLPSNKPTGVLATGHPVPFNMERKSASIDSSEIAFEDAVTASHAPTLAAGGEMTPVEFGYANSDKYEALVAKVKQFVAAWDKWDALMVVYAAELKEMVADAPEG